MRGIGNEVAQKLDSVGSARHSAPYLRELQKRPWRNFLQTCLALFLALSSLSQGLCSSILVRGVTIELPFELRILLKEIKNSSAQARHGINLSGMELTDESGKVLAQEKIHCEVQSGAKLILNENQWGASWLCRSGKTEIILKEPLTIQARAGFLDLDSSTLRGRLMLVPKKDKLLLINLLGIEAYLAGLVNAEIRSDYPPEAVKAQIIAARSYALATSADRRKAHSDYDLVATEADQVYGGTQKEDAQSFRLVHETWGQVLFHAENVLKAYFHAASGGFSEVPQDVWGEHDTEKDRLAYLARPSPEDAELPVKWTVSISPVMGLRWPDIGRLRQIHVLTRSTGHRVKTMKLNGTQGERILSGEEFKRRIGARWLKSTLFTIRALDHGWLIEGQGFGHGVGLSQLGARALAKGGQAASSILSFYYPYSTVRRLNLSPRLAPSIEPLPDSSSSLRIGTR